MCQFPFSFFLCLSPFILCFILGESIPTSLPSVPVTTLSKLHWQSKYAISQNTSALSSTLHWTSRATTTPAKPLRRARQTRRKGSFPLTKSARHAVYHLHDPALKHSSAGLDPIWWLISDSDGISPPPTLYLCHRPASIYMRTKINSLIWLIHTVAEHHFLPILPACLFFSVGQTWSKTQERDEHSFSQVIE